jgi:ABC-2 type transport system permease protein
MGRYLRLYLNFVRFAFSRAMEFRFDFFFRVVMDVLWNAVNIAFFAAIYLHTPLLGGWNFDQVLVFAGGVFFSDGVQMTVLSNNMWFFPILVNKGDVDYYLVRPVSSLFFLSFREFAANSFLNLVIATGILTWSIARYPGGVDAGNVVLYVAMLGVGLVIQYAVHLAFLIPVFWLHSAMGLGELFFVFGRYTGRPHQIFTGWVRRILTSVLPFSLIVSYPAKAFFEGFTWSLVLHMVGVAVLSFLAMLGLWRLGLRAYASASS